MHTSVICYYQDQHKEPDGRSLSAIGYQVSLNVWSISWSKVYLILLLTPVIPAPFGTEQIYRLWRKKSMQFSVIPPIKKGKNLHILPHFMVEYLLEGLNLKPIIIGHILVKIQNET